MKKILILISLLAGCTPKPTEFDGIKHWSAVELLRKQHKEELSEWDKLILAIAYTESRFSPDALGKAGDSGCLQITKPYTDELNRLYGTDYTPSDAFDIDTSLEMYELMQSHYNEERNLDRAIYLHNKSQAYKTTVLKNLEMIRNYELIRAKLIEK